MKLFVGLGNPGKQYAYNRHNIGFMVIDTICSHYGLSNFKEKFTSFYETIEIKDHKIIVQKPQTYMNLSGKAVASLCSFYKIIPENIFIFQDDLDLSFLQVKYKTKSGHGGHNGIRDIQQLIGNNVNRIKIGIDRPKNNIPIDKYVLSNFTEDELIQVNLLTDKISKNITMLLEKNFNAFTENLLQS